MEEKLKSENYAAVGGVDRKSSPYLTPQNSFLTLENVDFRTIGSLSSAMGTTAYTSTNSSTPITGLIDYYARNTLYGSPTAASYVIIATNQTNAYDVTGGTFLSIYTFLYPQNTLPLNQDVQLPFNFSRNQYLFGANGFEFITYPGATTAWQYSLPAPYLGSNTVIYQGAGGVLTGLLSIYFAFVRSDGFLGPQTLGYSLTMTGQNNLIFRMPTLDLLVGANLFSPGISAGSFGISGVQVWYSLAGGPIKGYYDILPLGIAPNQNFNIGDANISDYSRLDVTPEDYFGTFLYGFNTDNGANGAAVQGNFNPTCLAIFNNALFAGGFGPAPDDVWYSQPGNFEKHDQDAFLSVRSGDGDIVSGLCAYFSQLVMFKINSITTLSGTDRDNYFQTEVTDQYGCLGANAKCVWEQNLWFLDKKGICEYNGANTKCISNPVEDYFLRMNVPAARYMATMLHVKERNEVWCAIPIDGATYNNIIIIFDYLSACWRTRTIDKGTALNTLTKGVDKQIVFMGNYSGMINTYGHSFFTDNGVAFTSVIKSRFLSDLGHSVEKQWRRLFLDAKIPQGMTYIFPIKFYVDQGISPALSTTMVLSSAQNRIDFGLPGKDLAFEMFYSQGEFLQLNGFTIEYRFQRAV